jgi:hypothetical protein
MQVKLNSDDKVHGGESLATPGCSPRRWTSSARFAEQVTRMDVHLGDASATHGQVVDKRCTLEARLAGHAPLAVSHEAAKVADAMHGALDKLQRKLDTRWAAHATHTAANRPCAAPAANRAAPAARQC